MKLSDALKAAETTLKDGKSPGIAIESDGPYDAEFWYRAGVGNGAPPVTAKSREKRIEALWEQRDDAFTRAQYEEARRLAFELQKREEEALMRDGREVAAGVGPPAMEFRFDGPRLTWTPFRPIDCIQLPPGCGDIVRIERQSMGPTGIRIFAERATLFLNTQGKPGEDWTLTTESTAPYAGGRPARAKAIRDRFKSQALFRSEADFKERTIPAAQAMADDPSIPLTFENFLVLCRVSPYAPEGELLRGVFNEVYEPKIREQRQRQAEVEARANQAYRQTRLTVTPAVRAAYEKLIEEDRRYSGADLLRGASEAQREKNKSEGLSLELVRRWVADRDARQGQLNRAAIRGRQWITAAELEAVAKQAAAESTPPRRAVQEPVTIGGPRAYFED